MAQEPNEIAGQDSNDASGELKKKVVDQASETSVHAQEDQLRSSLHYGEHSTADTAGSEQNDTANETDTPSSDLLGFQSNGLQDSTPERHAEQSSENANYGDAVPGQGVGAPFEHPDPSEAGAPDTEDNQLEFDDFLASAENATHEAARSNQASGPPSTARTAGDGAAVATSDEGTIDHDDGVEKAHTDISSDSTGVTAPMGAEAEIVDANDAPTSISLSSTSIAENAQGAVVGTLEVADLDVNDEHTFVLSDDRFEVVDGSLKVKDGIAFDHEENAQISVDVTATDSAGAEISHSFEINVAEMPEVTHSSGFHASYYDVDHSLKKLDQVDWDSAPTHQELVSDIDYTKSAESFWEGGSQDTFGAKITGNIEVEEGGTFNFHVGGDDGVAMFVNGVEVVENDGLHGFRTRSGEVDLEPGTHVIEVRYFENYGQAGLKVEWEGPGVEGRELLSAPETGDLQTVSGMPLSLNLDMEEIDVADGSIHHFLEGMPTGTIVQAGDISAEVGDDGAVDVTGWDSSLISVTPPVEFTGQVEAKLTTERTLENGDVVSNSSDLGFSVDAAHVEAPQIDVQSGFRASYYDVDHQLRELDDINWEGDPTHEEVVGEVNYENGRGSFWEGGSTDTFGAKITGQITIEEGGSYDFFIGGDDGVALYIDGVEVIDNDGRHGFRTRSGETELEPGTHDIEVRYFENYGKAGLKLEWEGPDTDGRELVQADPELNVAENGSLEINLDTDISDTVTISGLPDNTILMSGEDTAVSDGSDMDLSGWNLDMIEFMPPSGFVGEIEATISVSGKAFNGQSLETQQEFRIEVGDVDQLEVQDTNGDEMLMIADSSEGDLSNGWSDEPQTPDDISNAEDDDAMREAVEMTQSSDQSHEGFETYERQDW